jgi:glutamate N-acetyltransferase/amino-acid N-acetyltransferase
MAVVQAKKAAPGSVPVAMPVIDGCQMATAMAGIRYQQRTDLLLMSFDVPAAWAAVFTRSACPAAPVDIGRRHLAAGAGLRAIVVNSGNANAFTGKAGEEAALAVVKMVAEKLGCTPEQVLPSSTGVIGEPLPVAPFAAVMDEIVKNGKADQWEEAARAIMTTDAFPKYATRQCQVGGKTVTLNGIAKGAGMIAPDMATMLAYVVTDAELPSATLQALLRRAVEQSFNAVTVDGDCSTNDTVVLVATGRVLLGGVGQQPDDPALQPFAQALDDVTRTLALMLVRDGEGATKLVKIRVEEAESVEAARKIARAIADSPLVKTALAGEDPNWGRVVMAVGKSGQRAERDRLWIRFGELLVAEKGQRHPAYQERDGAAYMKQAELELVVGVGVGEAAAHVWTCDLGHEYVAINADYRS